MFRVDHCSGSTPSSYERLMSSKMMSSTGTYFSTSGVTPSSPLLLLFFKHALAFLYSSKVKGPSGMGRSIKMGSIGLSLYNRSGGLPKRFLKCVYQVAILFSALSPRILADWEDFRPDMSLISFQLSPYSATYYHPLWHYVYPRDSVLLLCDFSEKSEQVKFVFTV